MTEVTPLVGVWIEITITNAKIADATSLPLWECGLKSRGHKKTFRRTWSLPLWECGLKYHLNSTEQQKEGVTPLVGVWIEIYWL